MGKSVPLHICTDILDMIVRINLLQLKPNETLFYSVNFTEISVQIKKKKEILMSGFRWDDRTDGRVKNTLPSATRCGIIICLCQDFKMVNDIKRNNLKLPI